MEAQNLKIIFDAAEQHVAAVRTNLLVVAQNGHETGELAVAARALRSLKGGMREAGFAEISSQIDACEQAIDVIFTATDDASTRATYRALDLVSAIEASLLDSPLRSGEFLTDIDQFVDAGFQNLAPTKLVGSTPPAAWLAEEFDIDEETLEIFRGEAIELISNIERDLDQLRQTPGDRSALWDIRRNAHTFKGAAGVVGLKEATQTAHYVEDLLDRLVEKDLEPGANTIALISTATIYFRSVVGAEGETATKNGLDDSLKAALDTLSADRPEASAPQGSTPKQTRPEPIVRVSLKRLDDMIELAVEIADNRARLEAADLADRSSIEVLLAEGRALADSLSAGLRRIRMQRFSTLETRLHRAVHVTCQDEGKLALLTIEDGDIEIDTQLIDGLVEPLLHLLRNAVVHGIEPPDTRRLLSKPERGSITLALRIEDGTLLLSIADDGRGLIASALLEKAVANGAVTESQAKELGEREIQNLIFEQGLSTSSTINLNAGRGIGMSIVRESIESLGGQVNVLSEPHKGTRFLIEIPLERALNRASGSADHSKPPTVPLVLIVDDSASIRRHNAKLVEAAGCRSVTAIDGVEAMEILLSGNWMPDLILSDVEMPRMDGWELLETLKESDDWRSIPVVLVTSLDGEDHRARADMLGAANLVVKPLTAPQLLPLISNRTT